jgi:hypothetical protein
MRLVTCHAAIMNALIQACMDAKMGKLNYSKRNACLVNFFNFRAQWTSLSFTLLDLLIKKVTNHDCEGHVSGTKRFLSIKAQVYEFMQACQQLVSQQYSGCTSHSHSRLNYFWTSVSLNASAASFPSQVQLSLYSFHVILRCVGRFLKFLPMLDRFQY